MTSRNALIEQKTLLSCGGQVVSQAPGFVSNGGPAVFLGFTENIWVALARYVPKGIVPVAVLRTIDRNVL